MSRTHARYSDRRLAGLFLVWTGAMLAVAVPAYAQPSGEAHVVVVEGGYPAVRFGGLAGGGSIVFGDRLGIDGEYGVVLDRSGDRSLAGMLSGGASLRFPFHARIVPFASGGFVRLGTLNGPYAGGGVNYRFHRAAALRVEFRSIVSAPDTRLCATDRVTPCFRRSGVWSVRAGVTFGFAR